MMFQVLCERGHPLSLDAALKGAGLPPKMSQVTLRSGEAVHISGAEAPQYWQAGEYAAVAAYCAADAERTVALAAACQRSRRSPGSARRGGRTRSTCGPAGSRWSSASRSRCRTRAG